MKQRENASTSGNKNLKNMSYQTKLEQMLVMLLADLKHERITDPNGKLSIVTQDEQSKFILLVLEQFDFVDKIILQYRKNKTRVISLFKDRTSFEFNICHQEAKVVSPVFQNKVQVYFTRRKSA